MLDIIKGFFTADFLFTVIRVGTPLLYASMSAYFASSLILLILRIFSLL